MPDWLDFTPAPPITLPITIYSKRHFFHKWWKKMLVAASFADTNVVVTGSAGAGKTAFTQELYSEQKSYERKAPKPSTNVEMLAIEFGSWTKVFSVLPGQNTNERQVGLRKCFDLNEKLEGVVHVVDFGFTTLRSEIGPSKLIEEGIDTIEKLRNYNLVNELEDFKAVCDTIHRAFANNNGPKWLVIAVNKIDLYFHDLDQAKKYYSKQGKSPFVDILNDLIEKVGSNNLKVQTVPICPSPKPYLFNGQKELVKLESHDEPKTYMKNFTRMFNEVSE